MATWPSEKSQRLSSIGPSHAHPLGDDHLRAVLIMFLVRGKTSLAVPFYGWVYSCQSW
jgi:hypothetical protein